MARAVLPMMALMPPPRERRTRGTCRVCGCRDGHACETRCDRDGDDVIVVTTCRWVEPDLCSRCWHPVRRLTRRQRLELGRIAAIKGPIRISDSGIVGVVRVTMLRQREPGEIHPRSLLLNTKGRCLR